MRHKFPPMNTETPGESLQLPPSERKAINTMADKFRAAIGLAPKPSQVPDKPAQTPAAAQPATPAEQKTQPEESPSRKHFRALEESRNQHKAEVEAAKSRLAA